MEAKIESLREKVEKIIDLRCVSCPHRNELVRDILELTVMTHGEAIVQMQDDIKRTEDMKKKTGGW